MTPSTLSSLHSGTCTAVRAPPRSTRARRCGSPARYASSDAEIDVMYEPFSVQKAIGCSARTRNESGFSEKSCVGLRDASQGDSGVATRFQRPHAAKGRFTKLHRLVEHRLKHRRKSA